MFKLPTSSAHLLHTVCRHSVSDCRMHVVIYIHHPTHASTCKVIYGIPEIKAKSPKFRMTWTWFFLVVWRSTPRQLALWPTTWKYISTTFKKKFALRASYYLRLGNCTQNTQNTTIQRQIKYTSRRPTTCERVSFPQAVPHRLAHAIIQVSVRLY